MLVSSLHWNRALTPARARLGSRVGEPASEREGKQAKSKSFLLPCPLMWAATEGVAWGLGWVQARASPRGVPSCMGELIPAAKLAPKISHQALPVCMCLPVSVSPSVSVSPFLF